MRFKKITHTFITKNFLEILTSVSFVTNLIKFDLLSKYHNEYDIIIRCNFEKPVIIISIIWIFKIL